MPARSCPSSCKPLHAGLLAELQAASPGGIRREAGRDSYTGSGHPFYGVSVPERRRIAKRWIATHRDASIASVLGVVDALVGGESHEEKTLAAILLAAHRSTRRSVGPPEFDRWLDHVAGWAEVDTFCQNVIPAEQMLDEWERWRPFIDQLSIDSNINKRRAALVLLTGPAAHSSDPRLAAQAVATMDRLIDERDILITKAVSWLLRSMITHHRQTVIDYLTNNDARLPRIALRETRTKLTTGTKGNRGRTVATRR